MPPSNQQQEQEIDPEIRWLADVVRDRGLVTTSVPESLSTAFRLAPSNKLTEEAVQYEPRSLAAAPSGLHVAVGTKAGAAVVMSFDGEEWRRSNLHLQFEDLPFVRGRAAPRNAIRLLHWIGERLLVGLRTGYVGLFERVNGNWIEVANASTTVQTPYAAFFANPATDPVANRNKRVVDVLPLVASDWQPTSAPRIVAFIRTETERVRAVRLSSVTGKLQLQIGPAEDPQGFTTESFSGEFVGVFGLANEFMLTSDGCVFRIAQGADVSDKKLLMPKCSLPTPFGQVHERFDGVRSSKHGFGLRCGEMFTALPWRALEQQDSRVIWVPIHGGRSFEVMQPFDENPPSNREPLWMLTATDRPGLTWVAWAQAHHGEGWVRLSVHKDHSYAGMRRSEVMELVVVGKLHSLPNRDQNPEAPPLTLVTATRDHHLCAAPFVDIQLARSELFARVVAKKSPAPTPVSIPTPGATGSDCGPGARCDPGAWAWLDESHPASVVLWCAKTAMCQDFGVEPRVALIKDGVVAPAPTVFGVLEFEAIPKWLRALQGNDLRELARFTQRILQIAKDQWPPVPIGVAVRSMDQGTPQRAVLAFRMWTQRLLRRASELRQQDPQISQDVAARLHTAVDGIRHADAERLHQIASLLRKWVLKGHTYRSKETGLLSLARWNWDCGRDLDAFVYAIRLLRRRVDLVATSRLETPDHTPGIWDLRVSQSGYAVHSHHDGRICATGRAAEVLRWEGELPDQLETPPDRSCVRMKVPADSQFRATFGHSPHARAIAYLRHDDMDYVFFAFQAEQLRRTVTLWVLEVEPESESGDAVTRLVVRRTASVDLKAEALAGRSELTPEVYSLHVLESREPVVLVGTRSSPRPTNAEEEYALRVVILDTVTMALREGEPAKVAPEIDADERSSGITHELQYDPTWQIASLPASDGHSVAVGRHDGTIRMLRFFEDGHWEPELDATGQRSARLRVQGSISSLEMISVGNSRFVAFGTTAGHYGVWDPSINRMLVHGAERTWIRAVRAYSDEGRLRLLTLSERGRCSLVSLDDHSDFKDGMPERVYYRGLRVDRFRITSDRDDLPDFRAARVLPGVQGSATSQVLGTTAPELVVGAVDGQVRRYELTVPRESDRRAQLFQACRAMFPEFLPGALLRNARSSSQPSGFERPLPTKVVDSLRKVQQPVECVSSVLGLAGAVGGEWIWRLLRAWDETGDEILRYSLWAEMKEVLDRVDVTNEDGIKALRKRSADLADEVYRREPFSPEAIKIVIDSLARVSHSIGLKALSERRDDLLDHCTKIHADIENLCWQWAGADGRIEARLLMHAFEEAFDWTDILLLSAPVSEQPHPWVREKQWKYRDLLVYRTLQTRLFHQDPVVAVDTLRVMNAALTRALDQLHVRGRFAHLRVALSGRKPNFADLLSMVGEAVYRRFRDRPTVAVSEPMLTEAYRFFGGAAILCPEHALGVGMIVSESRIPNESRVADFADACLDTLSTANPAFDDIHLRKTVGRLRAYLAPGKRSIADGLNPSEQRFLNRWVSEPVREYYENEDIRYEQLQVDAAIDELSVLGALTADPPSNRIDQLTKPDLEDVRGWSLAELHGRDEATGHSLPEGPRKPRSQQWRYFNHSKKVIEELRGRRSDLLQAIKMGGTQVESIIRDARAIVARPAALFEPQRSQFVSVIDKWEASSHGLGIGAAKWVFFLESHNRHKYQAGAAQLLASVAELAVTYAPFVMDRLGEVDLRAALTKNLKPVNPALDRVVTAAGLLADDARISAAVLHAVIRDGKVEGHSQLDTLADRFRAAATPHGVEPLSRITADASSVLFRGPDFIWSAIFFEAVINAKKHANASKIALYFRRDPAALIVVGGEHPANAKTALTIKDELAKSESIVAGSSSGFGLRMIKLLCSAIEVDLDLKHCREDSVDLSRDLQDLPESRKDALALVFYPKGTPG